MPGYRSVQSKASRLWPGLLVALASASLVNAFYVGDALGNSTTGWLNHLELAIHQAWLQGSSSRPDPRILLVGIQKETRGNLGVEEPFLPRSYHAQLIEGLREAGARVLGIDLVFADRWKAEDDALCAALSRNAPLAIALATDYDENKSHPDVDAPTRWRYYFHRPVVMPYPAPPNVVAASAVAFDPGKTLRGAILVRPDSATGMPIPHLSLAVALGALGVPPTDARWDRDRQEVRAGPWSWPVGPDGELILTGACRAGTFPVVEYSDALRRLRTKEGRALFHDKIVLLGDLTGADVKDGPDGPIAGTEFVAYMVNALLARRVQAAHASIPLNWVWGVLLAWMTVASVAKPRFRSMAAGVVAALGAALLVPWALRSVFWIDTAGPALAVLVAAAGGALFQAVHSGRLAQRFTPGYVRDARPEALVEEATILFVDLHDSTPMAERLGPAAVQQALSELLKHLAAIVSRHGGEVERTLGDGLMAVFRDPKGSRHALLSIEAAQSVLDSMEDLQKTWRARYGMSCSIAIGLESGLVSGGVVHAGGREEWSSFGPTVNLAARLQQSCRVKGVDALVGPGAYALAGSQVPLRALGPLPVKGVEEPVEVYGLGGDEAPDTPEEP